MNIRKYTLTIFFMLFATSAFASNPIELLTSTKTGNSTTYSANIEILILMTVLTFLPAIMMTMTSFMRSIIVLGLLRQAIGLSQTPSNQILIGLSLFMTIFIMSPVFQKINTQAVTPFLNNKISLSTAFDKGSQPLRNFMLNQTRIQDLNFFANLSNTDASSIQSREKIPFNILIPAYMTSELETAFQIGFILFIPFLIIDLIVSSTLMAMGMMMVSPMVISMPLKIMLFVMVNGWHLVFQTLAQSYY